MPQEVLPQRGKFVSLTEIVECACAPLAALSSIEAFPAPNAFDQVIRPDNLMALRCAPEWSKPILEGRATRRAGAGLNEAL
jgi:hypothetical protein